MKKKENNHRRPEESKRTAGLGFPGLASLTLAACGGGGGGSNVQPTPPNRSPVAAADKTVTLDEDAVDQVLSITAPTDPDGGNLTISVTAVPTGGTLKTADGAEVTSNTTLTISQLTGLVFTPDANLNSDSTEFGSFTYSVSDGSLSDSGSIAISVTAVNDAPELVGVMEFALNENTTAVAVITATDTEGDTLAYSISGGTDQALFTIDASTGALSFKTAPDYESPQDSNQDNIYSVQITVSDGKEGSASQTYVITVNNLSEAPIIGSDTASTNEDTALVINVLANDSDPDGDTLSVTAATASNGTVVINSDYTLSYTPKANFNGTDTLTYTASDGTNTTTGSVTVTVSAVNDAPVTAADTASTNEDTALVINVLANDSDPDGDTLSVTAATASNGTVAINSDYTLSYTPNANFNGTDTLTYTASDGTNTTTGSVTVTVSAVNDAPTAIALSATTIDENDSGAVVGTLTTTDVDASDTVSYALTGDDKDSFEVVSGQLKLQDSVTADYESKTSYSVTVTATDSGGASISKGFTISVVNKAEDVTGQVLDGYVAGATVFQDLNNNGILDDGIDYIFGGAGNDTLTGKSGDDTLDGGTGTDTLTGGTGIDTFVIRAGDGSSTLADADVVTDFNNGIDVIGLDGLVFSDLTIEQGTGIDYIFGGAGNDTLTGKSGNDTLDGGTGTDTLTGGTGIDTFVIRAGDGSSTLADADVVTDFNNGIDVIGIASDHIFGGAGNDTLTGKSGNDTLDGGTGTDTLTGGTGIDTFVIRAGDGSSTLADADVVTDFNNGIDVIGLDGLVFSDLTIEQGTGDYANHTLVSVTATGEYLLVLQNTTASNITEDDFAVASTSNPTLTGTAGDDTLAGTTYDGLTIEQGTGDYANHTLVSVTATGEYLLVLQNTTASNITEDDFAVASTSNPTLTGTAGDDTLAGTQGGDGIDYIFGGAGNDTLTGKSGNDTLDGGTGTDTLTGGTGIDTFVIRAGDGSSTLADADVVTDFNNGIDVIGIASDHIFGGAGNDTLTGKSGNDTLDGGTGTDTLTGGTGIDTFVIRAGDGSSTLADADVVTDFNNGIDVIGLDGLVFSDLTIEQGTGDYANHTLVSVTATGEYLLVLQNTTASNITEDDFAVASTSNPTLTGTAGDDTLAGTTYDGLTIEQGTGDYANHTLVSVTATGEYLLVLQNTTASNITEDDFAVASTSNPTLTGTAGDDTLEGTRRYDLDTLIKVTATGEYLLILQNTTASNITEDDFAVASTSNPTLTGTAGDDTLAGNDIEPNTTTDALGNFTLTLSSISNTAPVRIITGFDLATNEIHPNIMEISSTETGSYIITPISTLIGKLKAEDASLTTAAAEQLVATALGLTLTSAPDDSLLGYNPLALMNSSDATVATEAKPVYAANQLLMSLAGGSYRTVTYTVNDVLTTLTGTLQTIVNNNGGGTITLSVSDTITLGQKAYDALFNTYVDAMQTGVTPLSADFLTILFQNQQSAMQSIIKGLLDASSVTLNGTSYTYTGLLTTFNSVTSITDYIDSLTVTYASAIKTVLDAVFDYINTYVGDNDSGEAAAIGTALTQLNSGIKGLDLTQIFGTYINNDGTYPSGQNNASLITALNSKTAALVTLAADTLGDVLGVDTQTYFSGASVIILTSGNDTSDGTEGSNLIATLNGTDTVNGLGGNDKIIGGTGVDTFDGGLGNDHLYGYAGNDVLTGAAGNDKLVGGLGDDILTGGAGDDELQGKTGDDTLNTGAGSDSSYGGLGNDTFNITGKSGAFTDIIIGGTGTDTLDIDYTGVDSLSDFTITYDSTNGYIVLTDANGGVIKFSSIENLTVGDYAYTRVQDRDDDYADAYWNATEATLYLWDGNGTNVSSVLNPESDEALPGLTKTMDITVYGSDGNDYFNLNVNRTDDYTGNWTFSMGAGNDSFGAAALINGDSVDMGAGDDAVALMISSHTPTVAGLSLVKLDGGAGSDWLDFLNFTNTAEISLSTGGATNFENISGSGGSEIIKGDANANILTGAGGTDILYGYAGNDILAGGKRGTATLSQITNWDSDTYSWNNADNAGNNTLYGGAGDDKLYGGYYDDTLDGGTGTDTLSGGNGNDTFVIRTGDGSTTLANANVITDFSDGTDVISMDGVDYDDLTIAQGTGAYASHTLVSVTATGEYLLILQNITASNITAADFSSTSTVAQTFTGTSGNDVFIGGAGNDTFNGAAGSDELFGHGGNDTFNITGKSGAFTDIIIGGTGTDTLDIDYTGVDSLSDFTITYDSTNGYIVLTDANGGVIKFSSIENLTVGDYAYTRVQDRDDDYADAYWNATEATLYLWDGNGTNVSSVLNPESDEALPGLTKTMDITVYGSDGNDYFNLNVNRTDDYTGNWTFSMGAGNDSFGAAALINGDSVDMGAGDDAVALMISSHTPTVAGLSLVKLDGGAGSDWLDFLNFTNTAEISLSTGGATNFENISGSGGSEIIKGDANANILTGAGGTDILYGYAGNDILAGGKRGTATLSQITNWDSDTYSWNNADNAGNNTLYGGAGDDKLYGGYYDDTLDGGTGTDTLSGGNGNDTFVIRTGDGSTTLANANVITDFSDGTDVISMDGVDYDDLTIAQGTGAYASHTLVRVTATGEYLLILQNITASNITAADFSSTSTVAQTFTGTSGNDVFIGGAGNDTFNGAAGSDELFGHGGNDTFNITGKSGAFTDIIIGGTGTDTLDIDYTGVDSLSDFTITYDSTNGYIVLTDANGGVIKFSSIENLTVGDYAYTRVQDRDDDYADAYWNATEATLYLWDGNGTNVSSVLNPESDEALPGLTKTMDITVYGSDGNDYFNLNVNRTDDYTGNWTFSMGAGNDSFGAAALINGDSVDMGAGDDAVALMISSHTPTVAGLSLVKLDGGAGSDWLDFLNFTNTAEISLSTGGATNFENISGSGGSEIIKGDANANILTGAGGTDILYGYAGNDILAGGKRGTATLSQITNWDSDTYSWNNADNAGNNTLYGGAGDDKLYGGYYDDTLDGGTGTDTLSGGNGNDTFVIRTGDGSTTLANANVITDFSDGADVIGLDNDLAFSQLTIAQGTGAYASHTLVRVTATGEYLLILQNITASNITDLDFTAVDISESSIEAASALTAENNPLGSTDSETLTAGITLPESAPVDDSSAFFSEEYILGLLSGLIDLNPSGLTDDESLLLADPGDPAPSAQPATEYSVETTDLVADLSMADYYDDMMNYDILVGVSELG